MTREEAAEIIIAGPTYSFCPDCRGHGRRARGSRHYSSRAKRWIETPKLCDYCIGSGSRVRTEYLLACVVLHMPFPTMSKRLEELLVVE